MKTINEYLTETEQEFVKEFGHYFTTTDAENRAKSFLHERQIGLINLAREEEWKRCVDLLDNDHSNCPIKESCVGYQNAQSDLINQPPEILKNLELKDK